MTTLICALCGEQFERPAMAGRPPLYCSGYHRQMAYLARRFATEAPPTPVEAPEPPPKPRDTPKAPARSRELVEPRFKGSKP